jgi:hypothetical protein
MLWTLRVELYCLALCCVLWRSLYDTTVVGCEYNIINKKENYCFGGKIK